MATAPQAQPDPDLHTGLQFLRAGWFDRAEPLFRSARGRHGDQPVILHYLALIARRMGKLDEAARRFRDTIRRAPAHVEARLALAGIHVDQHKFTAAERELSE